MNHQIVNDWKQLVGLAISGVLVIAWTAWQPQCGHAAPTRQLTAKQTLTVVEMDHGEALQFKLANGRRVHLLLEDTNAMIIERVEPGGIVYQFSCCLRVDGQPIRLQRYVCSQECFYEPFVVNGLRIWPDIVKQVFDLVPVRYPQPGNLRCVPRKAARLALQDATLRICPDQLHPWLDEEQNFIDVGRCYNGDDCYLGPYLGQACHVGMDINQLRGSPLLAPIDFDTHAYFNSLEMGDNNNRWRGIRRWPNGDVWALQTHHLIQLTEPPNQPLQAGTQYATTAGVHVGSHEHTHFEFKVGRKNESLPLAASDDPDSTACPIDFDDKSEAAQQNPEVFHLDPWILFWQIFQDRKARQGRILAAMQSLEPVQTGANASFVAMAPGRQSHRTDANWYWTFGDGGVARGREVEHVFVAPGIYPVTLTVDNGVDRDQCTQHITVNGKPMATPTLRLDVPDELSFRLQPAGGAVVYGRDVPLLPHTLNFVTRHTGPVTAKKTVLLQDVSSNKPLAAAAVDMAGDDQANWLSVTQTEGASATGLQVAVDASGKQPGIYRAQVTVTRTGCVNSPQLFHVQMEVRESLPPDEVIVDDRDAGFYATPSFWVGHRFCRVPEERRGYRGFYRTDGGRAVDGQFVRFTPDLTAGKYRVSLSPATPFGSDTAFDVRVHHRDGDTVVRLRPDRSRQLGTYSFSAGTVGFVEIHSAGAQGTVMADAVVFAKQEGR